MITLRDLTLVCGCLLLAPAYASAQPAADGAAVTARSAPAAAPPKAPDVSRPAKAGADSAVRPASAVPPERIQVEPAPGARPKVAPQDDPRSVEEDKAEPDATDR